MLKKWTDCRHTLTLRMGDALKARLDAECQWREIAIEEVMKRAVQLLLLEGESQRREEDCGSIDDIWDECD